MTPNASATHKNSRTPDQYDVLVIGAGINGVGVAQDATLRGLRVLLIEQDDICSGVSAWSGRLIHGGFRYLEHYDIPLVRESLRERERLFRLAPHLVKPVRLVMPFYKHNRRPSWLIRLGMLAYDVLSFDKKSPWHEVLNTTRLQERFRGIGRDGLGGAGVFTDGQVELAERLCVEIAVDAVAGGADFRTHTRVDGPLVEAGQVVGVRWTDQLTGETGESRAAVVVNAAGPWIDQVLAGTESPQPRLGGGTKGSHLIVDPFPGAPDDVVYYESRRDGRLVLVIPWYGRYMIGTTDIRFEGDPVDARCDIGEAEYLLSEVNSLIPEAGLTMDDVLYTFSGVRPLPYAPGVPESKVPRSHVLHDHAGSGLPGLVTVVGGKLTTYRQLAQDVVEDVFRRLGRKAPPCQTKKRAFPGARPRREPEKWSAGAPEQVVRRLRKFYGTRAADVWALAAAKPALGEVIDPSTGLTAAELVFAVEVDLAATLTDVLARRVLLAFEPGHGLDIAARAADVLGEHLGWDLERRVDEFDGYRRWLDRLAVPNPDGPRSESFGAEAVESR
ncbi:glycerol-3-phosphate dehydrogenase [Georgenia soli]|uniref:Glycerol-3-phosphate dehydrogenase n=1 Tax=Georgenia soli TaxID=638953 RepID=A0A2A9F0G0_9MICO|nr:glycerol-3-phosphate dehydrogenase/oxidase [Georgenia soli]PFG44887.1 glycerol-3-phosphate dehydrogenase [Georgenia soli]